jgi:hypothetical protein
MLSAHCKLLIAAFAAAGLGLQASEATAGAGAPPAQFSWEVRDAVGKIVASNSVPLQPEYDEHDKLAGFSFFFNEPISILNPSTGALEAQITSASGGAEADPVAVMAFGVVDFGAPSSFLFSITSPFIPALTFPQEIKAGVSGQLADATGDGASVTPTGSTLQTVVLRPGSVNAGVDVGLSAVVPASASGNLIVYGPVFNPGPSSYTFVGAPWTDWTLSVALMLSGNEDAFSATSFAEIRPIPEPGTWAMILAGVIGMIAIARRRLRITDF